MGNTNDKKGTVKFYNTEKGYGFIQIEGEGDIFFHRSGLSQHYRTPDKGHKVIFNVAPGPKGNNAVSITRDVG